MKTTKTRITASLLVCVMLISFLPLQAFADASISNNEWQNQPSAYAINREDASAHFYPYDTEAKAMAGYTMFPEDSAYYKSLDGTWKFSFASKPADRLGANNNFSFTDKTYDDSGWDDITVPSSWQVNWNDDGTFKYDFVIYTNSKYPWQSYGNAGVSSNVSDGTAPTAYNGVGTYRRSFTVPENWDGRSVILNFAGVLSNCYVWINGRAVGYAEDSFTAKAFDITGYIDYEGPNVMTVQVFRWSDASYMEDQDMTRLSGIFRSVYLTARSKVALYDFEVKTTPETAGDYSGAWNLNIKSLLRDFGAVQQMKDNARLYATLYDASGAAVGTAGGAGAAPSYASKTNWLGNPYVGANLEFNMTVAAPKLWSSEHPNLYKLVMTVKDGDNILETTCIRVGFRQIEIVNKNTTNTRLLINGTRILFYGTNLHEFNKGTGHTMDLDTMRQDVEIMKRNNVNAIRMSHYPKDTRYYDLADEYGIYVIDEANNECHGRTGSSNNDTWGPMLRDRMSNMVERDKNYPSIVIWSMGNESGGGTTFRKWCTEWVQQRDPSRPTHAEFDNGGCEINSSMYAYADSWMNTTNSTTKPSMLCEYVYARGNANGGWDEYIKVFDARPKAMGGFIWDWVDKSILTPTAATLSYRGFAYDAIHPENDPYSFSGSYADAPEGYSGRVLKNGGPKFENIPAYGLTDNITVDCLVYSTAPTTGSGGHYTILGKGDHQYMIKETNTTIQWFVYDDYWRIAEFAKPAGYANAWHRLTGTLEGKTLRLYIDGVQVASFTGTSAASIVNQQHGVAVGDCTENAGRLYSGYIAEARILNRAMTSEEILALGKTDFSKDAGEVFRFEVPEGEIPDGPQLLPGKYGDTWYYAYGGDWGDTYNDGSMTANGMVLADRTEKPQAAEMKYQYRWITAELKNNATFTVNNKFLFTNANDYDACWELRQDDKVIQSGDFAPFDIGPAPSGVASVTMTSKDYPVPFTTPELVPGSEYFFNVYFKEKGATKWADEGHIISASHMPIDFNQGAAKVVDAPKGAVDILSDDDAVSVSGKDFSIEINKNTGVIDSYTFKGQDLLVKGPAPNFYRAPVENEKYSGGNLTSMNSWRNVGSTRTTDSVDVYKSSTFAIVVVKGAFAKGTDSTYTTTYTVFSNGEVKVDYSYDFGTIASNAYAYEIGSMMTVKAGLENMTWYGRGPGESYVDRKTGNFVGLYESTVSDQFVNYIECQEMGNKVDTRWMALTDDDGFGLLFKSNSGVDNKALLEFNALHYTPDQLATKATGYHPYQLLYDYGKNDASKDTTLRINYMGTGVGGNNGWGSTALEKYRINASGKSYDFSYSILPVEKLDKDAAINYYKTPMDTTKMGIDIGLGVSTIVENFAANVPVYVDSEYDGAIVSFEGTTAVVANGVAILRIPAAPKAGVYRIYVTLDDLNLGYKDLTVASSVGLWTSSVSKLYEGDELQITFAAPISGNITTDKGDAEISGNVLNVHFAPEEAGEIVISGLRYPQLFPSFSFTFTMGYPAPRPKENVPVGDRSAFEHIEAVTCNDKTAAANIASGKYIENIQGGTYVGFTDLYFGLRGATKLILTGVNIVSSDSPIQIWTGGRNEATGGTLLTTISFPKTNSATWYVDPETRTYDIPMIKDPVRSVYFVFPNGNFTFFDLEFDY